MFKTTDNDTLKQDKKCQPCRYIVLSTMSGSTTIRQSTARVNMGCIQRETCPTLFIHNVSDWNIEDPKCKPLEKVIEIRDVIESRVKELVTSLSQTSRQINF